MTTWENVFGNYNPYADTFTAYPNLYSQAVSDGNIFNLVDQIVKGLPYDLNFTIGVFFTAILSFIALAALLTVLFMPFLIRASRW